MLLRFSVTNHRSIRDRQELLLSASKRIKREGLTMPVPTLNEAVVPVAAIFGANAAGKSNLIDALDEFRDAVVKSHKGMDATDTIPRYPFRLDEESSKNPTIFDCTFTLDKLDDDEFGTVYDYGFEYTSTAFRSEWLYQTVRKQRQSTQMLFERKTENGQVQVNFGGQLRGENKLIANITRPNSLFLSASAQNNHPQLTDLYRYFAKRWKVIFHVNFINDIEIAQRLLNYKHMERLMLVVQQADIGITSIDLHEEQPDKVQLDLARDIANIVSKHVGPDVETDSFSESFLESFRQQKHLRLAHSVNDGTTRTFDYNLESKGTRTLISLLIPSLNALSSGSLLVVDELDTSLHPDLAKAFVSLFTRNSSNPYGAQLIFSTHDVTLLSSGLIHADEIWVSDKNRDGVSRFTPLTDFRLRSRDDIEKAYRYGRLGGVHSSDNFLLDFSRDRSSNSP